MSKIKLNLDFTPVNGKQISFVAPCSSADTECLVIDDVQYAIVDADGVSVAGLDNVWNSGALVSAILYVDTHRAFIQNANTNSYVEAKLVGCENHISDKKNPHNVTASQLGAGTFNTTDVKAKSGTDYSVARVRNISAGTADLTAGSSPLASGDIYIVYE